MRRKKIVRIGFIVSSLWRIDTMKREKKKKSSYEDDDFLPYGNQPLPEDEDHSYDDWDSVVGYDIAENPIYQYELYGGRVPQRTYKRSVDKTRKTTEEAFAIRKVFFTDVYSDLITYEPFKDGDIGYCLNDITQHVFSEESLNLLMQNNQLHPLTRQQITKIEKIVVSYA